MFHTTLKILELTLRRVAAYKMKVKIVGIIATQHKDLALGVDWKECAALQSQDGRIRVMDVTEHLGAMLIMNVLWNQVKFCTGNNIRDYNDLGI